MAIDDIDYGYVVLHLSSLVAGIRKMGQHAGVRDVLEIQGASDGFYIVMLSIFLLHYFERVRCSGHNNFLSDWTWLTQLNAFLLEIVHIVTVSRKFWLWFCKFIFGLTVVSKIVISSTIIQYSSH